VLKARNEQSWFYHRPSLRCASNSRLDHVTTGFQLIRGPLVGKPVVVNSCEHDSRITPKIGVSKLKSLTLDCHRHHNELGISTYSIGCIAKS
jgi:hypothetical protein